MKDSYMSKLLSMGPAKGYYDVSFDLLIKGLENKKKDELLDIASELGIYKESMETLHNSEIRDIIRKFYDRTK